jgi:hypothetical protein
MPSGCEQMKIDWPFPSSPISYGVAGDTWNGTVTLQFTRNSTSPANSVMVVADADGPVHAAFLQTYIPTNGCTFYAPGPGDPGTLREGKFGGEILYDDPSAPFSQTSPEALFGGSFDQLRPTLLASWAVSTGHGIAVSSSYYAAYAAGPVQIAPWGSTLATVWPASGVPGGAQQRNLVMWNDVALWASGDSVYYNILAWQRGTGSYPFFYYGSDYTQGASGLGTDLTDMVWTYRNSAGTSVMTSPYATVPSKLQPRRLSAYPADVLEPWIVGCGRAAHMLPPGGTFIVRLSDGFSWTLPTSSQKGGYAFGQALAMTCEELFVSVSQSPQANIARVRFDALGPGAPPN